MNGTRVLSVPHLSLGLGRQPKLSLTSLESPGKTAFHSGGLEELAHTGFQEPVLYIFSHICTQ